MAFCGDLLQLNLLLRFGLLQLHCANSLVVFFVCSCVAIFRINFGKKYHSIFLFGADCCAILLFSLFL